MPDLSIVPDLRSLPPEERVKHYRELCVEARQQAGNTPFGDVRDAYLKIATQWNLLAKETEPVAGREQPAT